MNIVIQTYGHKYIVRPDTTWKRDDDGLYVPDFAGGMSLVPILFARISRAGRSIGYKFAGRYYDGVNMGVLLYPEAMLDGSEQGFACASCLDHTTFLPIEVLPPSILSEGQATFTVKRPEGMIFEYPTSGLEIIDAAISEASRYIYLRTGDILGVELSDRLHIWTPGQNELPLAVSLNGKEMMHFYIR